MKFMLFIASLFACCVCMGQSTSIVVVASVCKNQVSGDGASRPSRPIYSVDCREVGRPVVPGETLDRDGCIDVPAECEVRLLFNGTIIELNKQGRFFLSEVIDGTKGGGSIGYMSRYLRYLSKAIDHTKDEKKLVENHRAHMETLRAGIRGFGSQDFDIHTCGIHEGNMTTMNLSFFWTEEDAGGDYLFRITPKGSKEDLFRRRVTGKSVSLVNGQIDFQEGQTYVWQVATAPQGTGPIRQSQPREFVFNTADAQSISTNLNQQPDYLKGSEHEKTLMYTFALEEAGYYYDAADMYKTAVAAYPGNLLVRRAAADFYMRMDMLEEAKALMR